jgi:hypothetical protein
MTYIELPRALEAYFAHAEIEPTRAGRRFTITLPYFDGNRLDRMQWWYHLTRDKEQRHGDAAIETLRAEAVERFIRHIERWLQNTGRRLHGPEPIPRIDTIAAAAPAGTPLIEDTRVIEEEKTAETPIAATSNAA